MSKKKEPQVFWCLVCDENNYTLEDFGARETLKEALDWFVGAKINIGKCGGLWL